VNTVTAALVPHAISLSRPVLGLSLLLLLRPGVESFVAPAIVLVGCASDWIDGRLARRLGAPSPFGRLFDNLCDVVFLALVFSYFAESRLWSPPVWGRLARNWDACNWLPLWALFASFGIYFVRLLRDLAAGCEPGRSRWGHTAGVANYGLAIGGAIELVPGVNLGPWLLEPAMVGVALLNALAVQENLRLLAGRPASNDVPPGDSAA
jgi:phosphatidylglycerophosphate synthase